MEEANNLEPAVLLTSAREFRAIDDLARTRAAGLPDSAEADMVGDEPPGPSTLWQANWCDRELVRWYQVSRLRRADGDGFLTEALSLSSPSIAQWPYGSLFSTRDEYGAKVFPDRLRRLRALYEQQRLRYVLCHGKDHWADFEKVFPGATFP